MKKNLRLMPCIAAMTLFAALAILVRLPAQGEQQNKQQPRYKLVDLRTFGGPQSVVSGFQQVLNNHGTIVGGADTPVRDPNFPNCFTAASGDCFVAHAFKWQAGVRTDLGALRGGPSSFAEWINERGVIVGVSQNGLFDPLFNGFPENRAVLWDDGQIINLGTLEGGYESASFAVNNRGQVVGISTNTIPDPFSFFGFPTQARAFLWQNGVMQDLGTLGGPDAFAVSVNNRGQVAGVSYTSNIPTSSGVPQLDPFIWENGNMIDVGSFGGTSGGPSALNNRGQVVGQSNLAGDLTFHPFLWDKGALTDLGTFGGDIGAANWINDAGEAVGGADFPGNQIMHAALWKDGTIKDLGTLPGDACSFALGINAKGQVVGQSGLCDFSVLHGFLWQNGVMYNLNDLIHPASNLVLRFPSFINDRGEIAGDGLLAATGFHAFLLIPCGEGDEGCADTANPASVTQNPTTPTPANPVVSGQPTGTLAAFRAQLARRYHIPGLAAWPKN